LATYRMKATMAIRTSESQVRLIVSTSLTSAQIGAFIADASLWVDEELATSQLSATRLELIERYLACALVRLRDLGLKAVNFDGGGLSEQYQVDPDVTDYLLRAAAFDKTGKIRAAFLASKDTHVGGWRVGTGFADE